MTAPTMTQAAPGQMTAQRATALHQFRYTRAQAARRVAGAFNTNLAGFAEPPVGHVTFAGLGDTGQPNPIPSADPATGTVIDPTTGQPATTAQNAAAIDTVSNAMIALSISQSALWGAGLGWVSAGDGRGAAIGASSSVGVTGLGLALVGLIVGRNGLALAAGGLAAVSIGLAGYLSYTRSKRS
jgi:hypothetical protein